jgi:RNA polymerase sigma factor (sigma-70 family)
VNVRRGVTARTEADTSDVVLAARAGDRRAMDELVAEYLPLVYNIVGRALTGHADVDDVVQETMLRVVDGIGGLRDPNRFRSWLVAITIRQINDRWRARRDGPALLSALGPTTQLEDPAADFVDLTILRLGLAEERREVAEASDWLEPGDRQLLSLWWLEAAGHLTRAELAEALGLSAPHAAVRVQRMRARLDLARGIVRALSLSPRCPRLAATIGAWDGHPDALWRKRIDRHLRHCSTCGTTATRLTPATTLLAGLPLVPPPASVGPVHLPAAHGAAAGGAHTATSAVASAGHGTAWFARIWKFLVAKPAAVATTAVVATSGTAFIYEMHVPSTRAVTPVPAYLVTPTLPSSPSAPSTASASPTTSQTSQSRTAAVYGSTVDEADAALSPYQKPATLPVRPADEPITATGKYEPTQGNPNQYVMNHNGDEIKLTGRGYFRVRWQIIYWTGRVGQVAMPSWTGLSGELFHVASGGGKRMNDPVNGATSAGKTAMGSTSTGYDTLPAGAQQMWQNEYYYLDGTVVLHQNQAWPSAGLIIQQATWQQITADVDTPPDLAANIERYGLVRDTGTDSAPVPQYLTRSDPADPATVPQHSDVNG